jgi:3-isopropylmalate dehydrogenase
MTSSIWPDLPAFDPAATHVIGVFRGEGVGGELVPIAMNLLSILQEHTSRRFELRAGGLIGSAARKAHGKCLTDETVEFVKDVFGAQGALFCGPGGERFVYELRREFDLYCKFTPLTPLPELAGTGPVKAEFSSKADIVAVRENLGGVYQGEADTEYCERNGTVVTHRFSYSERMVRRILDAAFRLAESRRRRLHVVVKPGGVQAISELWVKCARDLSGQYSVELVEYEIDNAVYQLIANPAQFDVIVSPNMFGDVIADCGALLLGSRGMSYSGNFDSLGHGVYQTGHGAAYDIAAKDVANPLGQILSLGMMLAESFSWPEGDEALRAAAGLTLQRGFRTRDIPVAGANIVGTQAFAREMEKSLRELLAGKTL